MPEFVMLMEQGLEMGREAGLHRSGLPAVVPLGSLRAYDGGAPSPS
jgi:hypothetical protein